MASCSSHGTRIHAVCRWPRRTIHRYDGIDTHADTFTNPYNHGYRHPDGHRYTNGDIYTGGYFNSNPGSNAHALPNSDAYPNGDAESNT